MRKATVCSQELLSERQQCDGNCLLVKNMNNYNRNTAEKGGYTGNSKGKEVSCKTEIRSDRDIQ